MWNQQLYNKLHYKKNRKKILARKKRQYAKDPEHFKSIHKRSYLKHGKKWIENSKLYYKKYPEKQYRVKYPERIRKIQRNWRRNNPKKELDKKIRHITKLGKLYDLDYRGCRAALSDWSLTIRKRDKKCQWCGTTKRLQAHHLLPKIPFPEHMFDLDNGITLCFDDHKEAERLQKHLN